MYVLSRALFAVVVLLICGAPRTALAESTLLYQGQVFGAEGAFTGTTDLSFRLFDAPSGGDPVWEESFENVSVQDGTFVVTLGEQASLDEVMARSDAVYLGITIGNNAEMQPRMLVGTALRTQATLHAKDVTGEDIHPRSVSVAGRLLIDEAGRWLGEQMGIPGPTGPAGQAGAGFDPNRDGDGDGFPDWLELLGGADPADANSRVVDENGDGVPDRMQGALGPAGPIGPDGSRGAKGAPGPPGVQGTRGPPGETGLRGPAGASGTKGPQGEPGVAGAPGERGERGPKGETGDVGDIGLLGPVGPSGQPGLQGAIGPQGPQGQQGVQGVIGPIGAIGAAGLAGPKGELGESGRVGERGEIGPLGPMGMRGPVGPKGIPGESGPPGARGIRGPQGEAGPEGPTGPSGLRGLQGNTGARGPMGTEGPRGLEGPTGPAGPLGPRGIAGEKGERGPTGLVGPAGSKGSVGDLGPAGPRGIAGIAGAEGPRGPDGPAGERGAKGARGAAGPAGLPGETGPVGDPGEQGMRGAAGPAGPLGATGGEGPLGAPGPRGEKGDRGDVGSQGDIGPRGAAGPVGASGPRGEKGDRGAVGPQGPVGESGLQGPPGAAGPRGAQGERGIAGTEGPPGAEGQQGATGPAGLSGEIGPPGPQGAPGASGPQGPQGLQGPRGAAGAVGPPGLAGERGESGPQGSPGDPGLSYLVTEMDEPAGANCPAGGKILRYGSDADRDGNLDAAETLGAEILCHGQSGVAGPSGAEGESGPTGPSGTAGFNMLVSSLVEPAGENCAQGGQLYRLGEDADRDGILQTGEVKSSTYVCEGGPGQQGATGPQGPKGDRGAKGPTGPVGDPGDPGSKGDPGSPGPLGPIGPQGLPGYGTLIRLEDADAGSLCAAGGNLIHFGKDQNDDNSLDASEIQGTQVICDGALGPQGPAGPPGAAGAVGPDGPTGPAGPDGIEGPHGPTGPIGATGPAGPAGAAGADGMLGPYGPRGPDGPTGPPGPDGALGQQGPAGPAGAVGAAGASVLSHSLIRQEPELGGPICPYSGTKILVGVDDSQDRLLQGDEVDDEAVICSVLAGSCATGYLRDGGMCVSSCGAGKHDGGDGSCYVDGACATGYELGNDGTCEAIFSEAVIAAGSFQREGTTAIITRPMAMMTTEVTQKLWKAIAGGNNPSHFDNCDGSGGDTCPVENVDWYSIAGFANGLSSLMGLENCYDVTGCTADDWQDGRANGCIVSFVDTADPLSCTGYRLPTEAEWEYAYRAGTQTDYYSGGPRAGANCDEPLLDDIGWYCGNNNSSTHPVGRKTPNTWGLYDMSGNVSEWVWDRNGSYPDVATDYLGAQTTSTSRINRGGSWWNYAGSCRASARDSRCAHCPMSQLGFRLTRTLQPVACMSGLHDGGDRRCVSVGTCLPGYHDGGDGTCVVDGTCVSAFHDGGNGVCIATGTCADGYHDGGDGSCVSDGVCLTGYHVVNGDCISDVRACPVANGTGAEIWDGSVWGACTVTSCDSGFHLQEGYCVPYALIDPASAPYVVIPAGTATLGSPESEAFRDSSELQREMTFTYDFAIGVTEVTQGQWQSMTGGQHPSYDASCGDDCPVSEINWFAALAYANALSEAAGLETCYTFNGCYGGENWWHNRYDYCDSATFSGLACTGYRLPTEVEWEYAYRAGTTTAYYSGPNSVDDCVSEPNLDAIGWHCGNANGKIRSVRGKEPNAWGVYDMAGNVWEWTWDEETWDWSAAASTDFVSSLGPRSDWDYVVKRGGSVSDTPSDARASNHYAYDETSLPGTYTGFRLVRTLPSNAFSEANLPAGSFQREGNTITISRPTAMMTTEVTQKLWKALSGGANTSQFTDCDGAGGDLCPVEKADWFSAIGFANALSTSMGLSPCYTLTGCSADEWKDGIATSCTVSFADESDPLSCTGYRLPTEAEWEYAYRAGTTTDLYNGDLTDTACNDPLLDDIGWYCGNANSTTHPVGQKSANAWGLFDMAGNVVEWTWDGYAAYPGPVTDYTGPQSAADPVLRGGSWLWEANAARAAWRWSRSAGFRSNMVGFRLIRTLTCQAGEHNGGDGNCVAIGTCSPGYVLGSDDNCEAAPIGTFAINLLSATGAVNNGLDLAGDTGLVLSKATTTNGDFWWTYSTSGAGGTGWPNVRHLRTASSGAGREAEFTSGSLISFLHDGFSWDSTAYTGDPIVAYSFKKTPGFFDVVHYTGDGQSSRQINHSLGVDWGWIIVKDRSNGDHNWVMSSASYASEIKQRSDWHFYANNNQDGHTYWHHDSAQGSDRDLYFRVRNFDYGSYAQPGNKLDEEYVAFVFAHNPAKGIYCGHFETDGNGDFTHSDIGFTPRFAVFRADANDSDWIVLDVERGWTAAGAESVLRFNQRSGEVQGVEHGQPESGGFTFRGESSTPYVFMVIGN